MHDKSAMKAQFWNEIQSLSDDDKAAVLAFMRIVKGEIPSDPHMILRLNRDAIKMQRQGYSVPIGLMPMLAGLAMNIIGGVADPADRRILMSYYWHAEDAQQEKVQGALKRSGVIA